MQIFIPGIFRVKVKNPWLLSYTLFPVNKTPLQDYHNGELI
jgi:hypothetical protein